MRINLTEAVNSKEKPTIGAPILSFHKYKSSRAEVCVQNVEMCSTRVLIKTGSQWFAS